MAPEVVLHQPYDQRCDVHSFAMTALEMLSYALPFPALTCLEAAYAVAVAASRPAIPLECPEPIRVLITQCWAHEPSQRPSFAEGLASLAAVCEAGAPLSAPAADGHGDGGPLSVTPDSITWDMHHCTHAPTQAPKARRPHNDVS